MRTRIFLGLMFVACLAQATVYKWVDKDGKVHYSDEPKANAQVLELKENTQNAIALPSPAPDAGRRSATAMPDEIHYQLNIASPAEEATIRNNNGDFELRVEVTPELAGQHLLALFMDGKLQGEPQRQSLFSLKNIDRGAHSLQVRVVTQNGKVLASSSPRKIFLHQAAQFAKPGALPSIKKN
ncbi:DUF4124 domain-containing protein [Shewanella salipaludis]|uniref:DUF4124 domain-containing protein n=1 Tax=Shewanella salipaludis TaxID=2723052 RepID=A0A972G1L1_9GAMM|nr:DUF4124 domain-containing protein [Shewanella salipaludis]NMH67168.1 DUF4124 domain-containing protein [Shewanella salipaludis]